MALLHTVIVPFASHVDMLYIIKVSFRLDNFQWRSTCVFGAYIKARLIEFFGGFIFSKARNLSNIL